MNNELKIKPLLWYEVSYRNIFTGELLVDTFTADDFIDEIEPNVTSFFRTGNVIRVYHAPLEKIIITPYDPVVQE